MKDLPIALTGGTGQVGSIIQARRDCCALVNERFTQTMKPVIAELDTLQPMRLINAAAYTAVDRAETEQTDAEIVNACGPDALASWCATNDCLMVHFSTDYVFDGLCSRPYVEDDPARPINAYGRSKYQGEIAVLSHQLAGVTYRTSWVMGIEGHNFIHTMLRLGKERRELFVVNDQWGRPTSADLLAEAALSVTEKQFPNMTLFHLTDSGKPTNWHAIACYALDRAHDFGYRGLSSSAVRPISTAKFKTAARRPANSVLDCSKFDRLIGIPRPPWQQTVDRIVKYALRP